MTVQQLANYIIGLVERGDWQLQDHLGADEYQCDEDERDDGLLQAIPVALAAAGRGILPASILLRVTEEWAGVTWETEDEEEYEAECILVHALSEAMRNRDDAFAVAMRGDGRQIEEGVYLVRRMTRHEARKWRAVYDGEQVDE